MQIDTELHEFWLLCSQQLINMNRNILLEMGPHEVNEDCVSAGNIVMPSRMRIMTNLINRFCEYFQRVQFLAWQQMMPISQ